MGPTETSVAGGQVEVAAHTVKDVDLAGLPAGYDGLELTSNAPVVAGVQLTSGLATPGAKRDLAWTAAEPALQGLSGVPLGPLAAPWSHSLALSAATSDSTVDLVYVGGGRLGVDPAGRRTGRHHVDRAGAADLAGDHGRTGGRLDRAAHRSGHARRWPPPTRMSAAPLLSVAPLVDAPLAYTPVAVRPLGY